MSKNAKFKRNYLIEVEGITTNGFAEKLITDMLEMVIDGFNDYFKQVNARIVATNAVLKRKERNE
jgi:molybdopterin biosynthesis enzyme MoaB